MAVQLRAWRVEICNRGYLLSCGGLLQPLTICTAQLSSGRKCALCERQGAFPLPGWYRGECVNGALDRPSVQVAPTRLPSLPWIVIAFLSERLVDPRWPIIGARDSDEAIELALARASQLALRSKPERLAVDSWEVGRVAVLCGAAALKSSKWSNFDGS